MKKSVLSVGVALAAMQVMSDTVQVARHRGDIDPYWTQRYTNGGAPGEPGHGRPSVTRKKKAKTNGKNKRKRK